MLVRLRPEEQLRPPAEIAANIGTSDTWMVGTAFLLEQEGYERSQLSLLSSAVERTGTTS